VSSETRSLTVTAPDGRQIAVDEHGPGDGSVVIAHHGTPGSRLYAPGRRSLDELGIRMVTSDRAGYGDSTRQQGRTVVDAAHDTRAIADRLGLERFAVIGVSGGGPYALACGALLPDRVTRVCACVGVAPLDPDLFDWTEGLAPESVVEFELARTDPDALLERITPQAERMLGEGSAMIDEWSSVLPPSDREIQQRPENVAESEAGTRLALAQGPAGWFDDDISFTRPWGFELESIRVPVDLWYGAEDVLVPASYGTYLAERIPTAELTVVPGRGHRLDDEMGEILRRLVE